jgi:hypothetical protein
MANAKISDGAFIVTTDITTIDGLAGYSGAVNSKISGSALVSSLETNLNLDNFTLGKLPIIRGGTSSSTAQAAINALSNVSGASGGDVLTESGGNAVWAAPSTPTQGILTCTLRDLGANDANDEYAHFTPDLSSISTNYGGIAIPEDITITKIQAKYLGLTAQPLDTDGAGNEWSFSLEEIDSSAAIDTSVGGEITALLTTPASLTFDNGDDGTWPYKEWTGSVSATGGKILRLKQVNTLGGEFVDFRDVAIIISYETT